jgi:hypothetical protein
MDYSRRDYQSYIRKIAESKFSIYDCVEIGDPDLWIPIDTLEIVLNDKLLGLSLEGLAIRTRSKVLEQAVCNALGYPIPKTFKKTKPRFPGQYFDTYVQKSNNLQIWNDEISSTRRYVIIHLTEEDIVDRVKVITGEILATYDHTGTLTQKFQARVIVGEEQYELACTEDTSNLRSIFQNKSEFYKSFYHSPNQPPTAKYLLPISQVFYLLKDLVGIDFADTGRDQERNRGAELHKLVCSYLGYTEYNDNGQFPDILNQLLEIKLQMSPTIDLGLVLPSSTEALDIPRIEGTVIRHCDVRYAIFSASQSGTKVVVNHFILTTGESFFKRFTQFQGKVKNTKIQIPLPKNFFD